MNKFLILCLVSLALCSVDLESFRKEALERHNTLRAKHQVNKLTRYSRLETLAQANCDRMVEIGQMQHSDSKLDGEYVGENVCSGTFNAHIGQSCTDLWYSEEKLYDFNNPVFDGKTGHFTQVVWKNSKQLGCGVACDTKNYCYVTCDYFPAGNYYGQFKDNVLPKVGGSEDTQDTTTTEVKPVEEDDTPDSSKATDAKLEKFRSEALVRHNFYRAQHNAGDLVRSAKLEKIAQDAAEYMVKINNFHFPEDKYNDEYIGMSLFWYNGPFDGNSITDYWYDEQSKYDFKNPGYNADAGGFTQLVWKSSKKMGCGYACKGSECYGLCTYYPSGNYNGMFETNVFPKTK